jgi:hypothetical protein
MANTTFQGPVISKKGFYNTGPANVIDADSSTSLTVATHAGRIVHNDAAGAVTYTLPAVNATADSETVAASDTITLNGGTTGGVTYAKIICTVLASGTWSVSVHTGCTGSPATCFSAAV